MQRKWKHSLAGIALVLALGASPSIGATTINVSGGDVVALRQAIIDGNSEAGDFVGADTIILDGSTFTLPDGPYSSLGNNGLPPITTEITIEGNGSTIERDTNDTDEFRIFIVDGGGNLTINETTISGGFANGSGNEDDGGGFFIDNGSTLSITNSTISGNYASGSGGGIYDDSGTEVTIINSTIFDNEANNNGGGFYFNSDGERTINNSTITGNTAGSNGGGIYLEGGNLTVTNSTISDNDADDGGGIYTDGGNLTVTNSTITNNEVQSNGGGIQNDGGIIDIINSTISENMAFQGGGIFNSGTATITSSTISGNSGFEGGGIYNDNLGDSVTLTNTTISGNTADVGGGIYSDTTSFIVNSTITDNTGYENGGGFFNDDNATISNSIISGNISPQGAEVCNIGGISLTANRSNLFGHDALTEAEAFEDFSPGANDINATSDPSTGIMDSTLLGDILNTTLANNGGPTQTHALPTGSPAIDNADNCPPPTEDQRGFPRPIDADGMNGAQCDIGAFELQPTAKVTKITIPGGGTDFIFDIFDSTTLVTTFILDDQEMDVTVIPTGDVQIRELIPEDVIDLQIDCDASILASTPIIDEEAGTVDVTIMSSAEKLDCIFINRFPIAGGGGGGMDEDIDIVPGNNGTFAEVSISSGIPGGGTIFIDLPDDVLALAASLVPNIAPCEIVESQTANIEDADVVCDIQDFPFEIDVILNLCRQGNVSGVAEAVVEVISDDRPEESAEETIEILLNDLELCQATGDGDGEPEPGGDGDSSGDGEGAGSGCAIAPANTTSTNSVLVTLLSAVAGIAGVFFRRRKQNA